MVGESTEFAAGRHVDLLFGCSWGRAFRLLDDSQAEDLSVIHGPAGEVRRHVSQRSADFEHATWASMAKQCEDRLRVGFARVAKNGTGKAGFAEPVGEFGGWHGRDPS